MLDKELPCLYVDWHLQRTQAVRPKAVARIGSGNSCSWTSNPTYSCVLGTLLCDRAIEWDGSSLRFIPSQLQGDWVGLLPMYLFLLTELTNLKPKRIAWRDRWVTSGVYTNQLVQNGGIATARLRLAKKKKKKQVRISGKQGAFVTDARYMWKGW